MEIKDKSHDCKDCGKAFGRPRNLQRHISSVHEGVKNHECEPMGNEELIEGVNKYKCGICGKTFNRPIKLLYLLF